MTVKVGSLKGCNPFKNPLPLSLKGEGKGERLIKMMTDEAIQMVRGEIASPLARNDRGGGGVTLIIWTKTGY